MLTCIVNLFSSFFNMSGHPSDVAEAYVVINLEAGVCFDLLTLSGSLFRL